MICLAVSAPLEASRQPRSLAVGSTDSTPFTHGSVRPDLTSVWFGQPNSTITIGLSGCAAFHCFAISAPIANEIPASSLRAIGMPLSPSGLKNDVMMMPLPSASCTAGFTVS